MRCAICRPACCRSSARSLRTTESVRRPFVSRSSFCTACWPARSSGSGSFRPASAVRSPSAKRSRAVTPLAPAAIEDHAQVAGREGRARRRDARLGARLRRACARRGARARPGTTSASARSWSKRPSRSASSRRPRPAAVVRCACSPRSPATCASGASPRAGRRRRSSCSRVMAAAVGRRRVEELATPDLRAGRRGRRRSAAGAPVRPAALVRLAAASHEGAKRRRGRPPGRALADDDARRPTRTSSTSWSPPSGARSRTQIRAPAALREHVPVSYPQNQLEPTAALRKSLQILEADARTRTADPFITSEVLYQLSYVGLHTPPTEG